MWSGAFHHRNQEKCSVPLCGEQWTRKNTTAARIGVIPASTAVIHTCAFTHSALQLNHGSPPPYLPAVPPGLHAFPASLHPLHCGWTLLLLLPGQWDDNEWKLRRDCFLEDVEWGVYRCWLVIWVSISFCLGCGVWWVFNNSYDVILAWCLHPPHCYSALGFTESGSCFGSWM